ncbi:hypothetical protein T484DRAFT_1743158 [Baffinella frigidus]|nr:hypothetical protein T484DRAFT_1743158 [Cryptophyta sp. CCMP2293]
MGAQGLCGGGAELTSLSFSSGRIAPLVLSGDLCRSGHEERWRDPSSCFDTGTGSAVTSPATRRCQRKVFEGEPAEPTMLSFPSVLISPPPEKVTALVNLFASVHDVPTAKSWPTCRSVKEDLAALCRSGAERSGDKRCASLPGCPAEKGEEGRDALGAGEDERVRTVIRRGEDGWGFALNPKPAAKDMPEPIVFR